MKHLNKNYHCRHKHKGDLSDDRGDGGGSKDGICGPDETPTYQHHRKNMDDATSSPPATDGANKKPKKMPAAAAYQARRRKSKNGNRMKRPSQPSAPTVGDGDGGEASRIGRPQRQVRPPLPPARARPPRQSRDDSDRIKQIKLCHPSPASRRTRFRKSSASASISSSNSKIGNDNNNGSNAQTLRQEYNVDHSCSTPLERLAREVGNALRAWHVDGGCDRHASLDWAEMMEELEGKEFGDDSDSSLLSEGSEGGLMGMDVSLLESTSVSIGSNPAPASPAKCMSMDLCELGFVRRSRSIDRKITSWMGEEGEGGEIPGSIVAAVSTPKKELPPQSRPRSRSPPKLVGPPAAARPASARNENKAEQCGARCIRSKKISFQTIGYSPAREDGGEGSTIAATTAWSRRRYTVPLVLELWDAPRHSDRGNHNGNDDADRNATGCGGKEEETLEEEEEEERAADVPKSLQPKTVSPSSYSLLGELGILSRCGTERPFYYEEIGPNHGRPFATVLQKGLTWNLSCMFDIGQHITLCLDPGVDGSAGGGGSPKSKNDVECLYNDICAYLENIVRGAAEAARRKRASRERDRSKRRKKERRLHGKGCTKSGGTRDREERMQICMIVDDENVAEEDNDEGGDDSRDGGSRNQDDGSGHGDSGETDDSYIDYDSDDDDDDSCGDSLSENDRLDLELREIRAEAVGSLASILQTALNLAASENDCRIPVFGIWGHYRGDQGEDSSPGADRRGGESGRGFGDAALPSWILSASGLDRDYDDEFKEAIYEEDRGKERGLLLSSPFLSGTCQSRTVHSSHRVYFVPSRELPLHLSTLNGLSNVLLAQCRSASRDDGGALAVLAAARHCFRWERSPVRDGANDQDWRCAARDGADETTSSAIEAYRAECRERASAVLERASSPWTYGPPVPMWGPSEGDPLLSLSASVSWGVVPADAAFSASGAVDGPSGTPPPPLLQLPLKIRSSNFASASPSELLDVERALQCAALDPVGMGVFRKREGERRHEFGPREAIFLARAAFDADAPCATLSANARCVLAALMRCGSLGLDALPGHLTKREILLKLGGGDGGAARQMAGESAGQDEVTESERILRRAVELAEIGPVTRRLVDALDWGEVDVDLSSADFDRAITEVLRRIQSYPTPPVEVFSFDDDADTASKAHVPKRPSRSKGSPPGRLLSVLFAHMARLRTPPSMMRLWLSFVEELRGRWDRDESLPNLGHVPGLDAAGGGRDARPHWGLQRADSRVLGHRADHAAFVNSSEPDPDRDHCIINQKLQVYNICIECKITTEALYQKRMQNNGVHSDSDDDMFFDPEEEEEEEVAFYKNSPARRQNGRQDIEKMLMLQAAVMSPSNNNRVGARCPVPDGMPLIESGDQLYAPYLQRTMPMSDVEEEKQKKVLGTSKYNKNELERPSIRSRISIAQRLQKPKLLSDMSSFRAANPGAIFEDFVRWYGNPENPLHEEINGETMRHALERRARLPPAEAKVLALEEASEAIAILMSLRAFWEDTWEEAGPCPAHEQEPLFDPHSRVEMVLHTFETIHPALLMNQVLAVVLSNAKFVLESAAVRGGAGRVASVARGLLGMKEAVDVALEALSDDAADGFFHQAPKTMTALDDESDPLVYVSTSTVAKCEEACDVIGELEILLSRALSLLRRFPGEFDLADMLLWCGNERFVFVKRPRERSAFLGFIQRHQRSGMGSDSSSLPEAAVAPAMREYILRTVDSSTPCQLSARLVPDQKEAQSASSFHGSLLLALTKSSHG